MPSLVIVVRHLDVSAVYEADDVVADDVGVDVVIF